MSGRKQKHKVNTAPKTAAEKPAASSAGKQNPLWFYIVLILIPVFIIVLLEISLRIFNYGKELPQWVPVDETRQILNPEIAYKYFYTTKNIPQSNQNLFTIDKKPGTFRVFVFGESSAAGYPFLPNGSFTNYLQKRLELVYPSAIIEVVNVSISATNTFTMRDLMPGVIEQKPDLILFYAGHNEYYGALGVGSMESIGSSRSVVNTVLWLNQFKTVELLRNTIKGIMNLFSGSEPTAAGTLMSQMAKEQSIPFNSELFNAGLEQFEGNIRDMLEMAKEAKVPVLFGTLACNLRDQKPFISEKSEGLPPAQEIYKQATQEFSSGNYPKAAELFRYAKDLDALRFRAPEKINSLIKQLAKEYNNNYVDADSAFNAQSPGGIVGDNLMTDHLHPTLSGYWLLGKLYFEKMRSLGIVPSGGSVKMEDKVQDSLAIKNVHFTALDSVVSKFRIAWLKNDWPYIEKKDQKPAQQLFRLRNFIDSIAYKLVDGRLSWERAHREAVLKYLGKKMYDKFSKEIFVMADQYPFVVEYHDFASKQLVQNKQYELALKHLYVKDKQYPNAFSSKWIGNIKLFNNQPDEAIKYLLKSVTYENSDPQVFYNLAGAYAMKKDYVKAREAVDRCLSLNPNDRAARTLKAQLTGKT